MRGTAADAGQPPVVGIIGAGQLARMCAGPAAELGISLRVLAQDATDSAAQVVPDTRVGELSDPDAVAEFADGCDVVTFDHELVPEVALNTLESRGAVIRPGRSALELVRNKLVMREELTARGVPVPAWSAVHSAEELAGFAADVRWPVVLKTPCGGYDGRGVLVVEEPAGAAGWLARATGGGEGLLAEAKVDFVRELAVQLARTPSGQVTAWPVVETLQADGVCAAVIAPAPDLSAELAAEAVRVATAIAEQFEVVGVLAVELFELPGERFVVNELAMRPHNSGHWSMDGAVTGQFEQHLRAVLDWPLGAATPHAPWSVMVNVFGTGGGGPRHLPDALRDPNVKLHLYGKTAREGRKIGHLTVSGTDLDRVREQADIGVAALQR